MEQLDRYACVGFAVELLAHSPYHRQFPLADYLNTEIQPALFKNQIRFYLTEAGIPSAMVTWAWLSEEVEADLHETGRALQFHEWASGDQLFFNDWVTPYGNVREVLHDMLHNVFPDGTTATSLRRNQDGSVRKVNRWTGRKLRRGDAPGR